MLKKLLIIDNHDSFTFNLVDLLRKLDVPAKVVLVEELDLNEVEHFSHILISPGPDVPRAYLQTFAMLERYHQTKSILGVCLGHQTICEFFGGKLYNLNDVRHGQQRTLTQIEPNPIFKGLPKQLKVGLYHSRAFCKIRCKIHRLYQPRVCDQNVLMAFKHQHLPIFGVQFHPESFITEFGQQMLANWLEITQDF